MDNESLATQLALIYISKQELGDNIVDWVDAFNVARVNFKTTLDEKP